MGATDGDLLLRAILDDPAEDTARLIYADWLDENGQAERAHGIRWGCSSEQRSRSWPLSRSAPLVVAGVRVNNPTLPEWCESGLCNRGFISEVTCTAAAWLQWADAITAAHPVERVRFTAHAPSSERSDGVPLPLTWYARRWPRIAFELQPESALAPGGEPVAWEVPVRVRPAPDPGALFLAGLGWRVEIWVEPSALADSPLLRSAVLTAATPAHIPGGLLGAAFGPVRATDTFGRVWHVERAILTDYEMDAGRANRITGRLSARSAGPVRPA